MTPVIAIAATWIGVQQLLLAKLKVKLEWYERRLEIYKETKHFITIIIRDVKPTMQDIFSFNNDTADADFLFPPNIRKYLDEVFSQAWALYAANEEDRERPIDYDHTNGVHEKTKHINWFIEQNDDIKKIFKPFLNISKVGMFGDW